MYYPVFTSTSTSMNFLGQYVALGNTDTQKRVNWKGERARIRVNGQRMPFGFQAITES